MKFKVGDLVSRISHNHDIVFRIISIDQQNVFLKGVDLRLYADADIDDLTIVNNVLNDDDSIIKRNLSLIHMDRDNYFYIPGKILHIDAVCSLSKSKEKLH